jgi:SagB-type dehydrogenase family enzyme
MPLYRSQTRRPVAPEAAVHLSREILDRIERVADYHQSSKHTYDAVRAEAAKQGPIDWTTQPSPYRTFDAFPKVPLPSSILDAPVPTLQLLADGTGALPNSQITPPQTLKTLGTWLYLANGITVEKRAGSRKFSLRSCPSAGALFPFEIYVAAFAVEGLSPGLYHYSPREFALRRLRDGAIALTQLKRGRPDLEFLKTVPAALLVSTNFWRTAWRYKQRAYRYVLQDAGHLVQNLVSVGGALGIQTTTRLRLNDKTTRDLIGVPDDAEFHEHEAVQSMVVWADKATNPIALPARGGAAAYPATNPGGSVAGAQVTGLSAPGSPFAAVPTPGGSVAGAPLSDGSVAGASFMGGSVAGIPALSDGSASGATELPPIIRPPLSAQSIPYGSIHAAHEDCVAPGVAVRELRPPLTELSPLHLLPQAAQEAHFQELSPPEELAGGGASLRRVLLTRRSPADFLRHSIPRTGFWWINRLAFRGGSHFPIMPDGPHVGLVKPFWVLHDVGGMDDGVWFYDAPTDRWALLRRGNFRLESRYLALEQEPIGNAAAVCYLVSDLPSLMSAGGPDAYRLAHLEAGVVAQRIHLAACAMDIGCAGVGAFYDNEVRRFLDIDRSGWEPIYAVALGVPAPDAPPERPAALQRPPRPW